ncbi:MAG: ParA family protein [Pseudomonadota bacterium]
MSKIITIAGQKGGTGKTVTAVNLAASFALFEKKTLLIDCDPQGCSTQWCGVSDLDHTCDIASVLSAKARFTDAIVQTEFNYLDMMPASFNLFQAALKLSKKSGNEKILRLFLKDVEADYEYIVIDTPSSYSFLSIFALTAADWLLVCMTPEHSSMQDFKNILKMIQYIKTVHKVSLKISRVLFNRCKDKDQIHGFLHNQGLLDIEPMVCSSFIPEDENIRQSIQLKVPAALHDIKSPAAKAYLCVAKEIHFSFNQRGVL